jgi:hypothetical protein
MTELRKPEERECERCGRREVWDADADTWRVAGTNDDDPDDVDDGAIGDVHCVHEWDIDGSFRPIE